MACVVMLCTLFCLPSYSQFLPDLQARTPAEFDAYLEVLDGPAIEKGEAFLRGYPESALRLPVYEILAKEWRRKGERTRAVEAAERALAIAPEYAPVLVELADLLANGAEKLERAEEAARRGLEVLGRVKAPLRVGPEEWTAAVNGLRSRAHAALGMVRFKRNDTEGAVGELEASVALVSDAAAHYRLGRLYGLLGRRAEARTQLEIAARTKDETLLSLVRAAMKELR